MSIGRPDLVETIAAASRGGVSRKGVDAHSRRQMEARQVDKIKGRKSPERASYGPKDGAVICLGLGSKSASGAADAYTALAVLEAAEAGGGITHDPVGRLVPPLKVPTFDENEISRVNLITFTTAILSGISRLSDQDAAALRNAPEATSACLELNVDTSTAAFRWSADGKEYWVRFEHPGGTIAEVLGKEPPAYQTVTKIYFPLLFAVGRLFAAAPAHNRADPDPSSGEAPASAEPEKGNAAPARAASLGNWSHNSRTRPYTSGKLGGGGEILKPLPLPGDRLPVATPAQGLPASWPPPMT